MVRIDTNYIVRYFVNDNKIMADEAEEILLSKKVFIANEIIAEVIYVLDGVYGISRDKVADLLLELISFHNILVTNKKALKESLEIFKVKKLDFVDCLLCAYSKEDEILTFDKKLNKCIKDTKIDLK
jgi:predicted nucleic-acid-binding protein